MKPNEGTRPNFPIYKVFALSEPLARSWLSFLHCIIVVRRRKRRCKPLTDLINYIDKAQDHDQGADAKFDIVPTIAIGLHLFEFQRNFFFHCKRQLTVTIELRKSGTFFLLLTSDLSVEQGRRVFSVVQFSIE